MTTYRSLTTIEAKQFTGTPIPDITCSGSPAEVQANGCDSSRKQHLHVHTQAIGGMTVLQPGDWIFAVPGGPWGVAPNAKFRAHWEVPAAVEVAQPETATFPEAHSTPPVDVAVVPVRTNVPVIGADGSQVSTMQIDTYPDGSTNMTETPVESQVIPVPVPHTIEKPDTAVGEGLVAPSNPVIFTD